MSLTAPAPSTTASTPRPAVRITPGLADADLAAALVRQEGWALEECYRLHHRIALGVAYQLTGDPAAAEEVVQDAFVALWRSAARFDASRASLKTWLMTLVHNRAVDVVRHRSRRPAVSLEELALLGHAPAAPDAPDDRDVQEALDRLDPECRAILEMVYLKGWTREQVVARTGVPLGTVKRRLRQALESMRASLAPGVEGA